MSEILEIFMIVLFGCSWPNNIITSLRNKSTKGKSLAFLLLIDIGYVCGIVSKFISPTFNWADKWYVVFFYILNFVMVTTDLILYFHYRKKEKTAAKAE